MPKTRIRHAAECGNCGEQVMSRNIYRPKEGFIAVIDGVEHALNSGHFFREGHPVLDKYPDLFEPVRVQFDVEEATASPGELRQR